MSEPAATPAPEMPMDAGPVAGSLNAALAGIEAPEAAPDAEAPPAPPAPAAETPWTPERIEAERARLSGFAAKVENRDRKFQTKLEAFRADKVRFDAAQAHVSAQIQRLRTGDAAAVMDALSSLTGKPAKELYTEISLSLAHNGKPKPGADVEALRAELAALRKEREDERAAAVSARDSAAEAEVSATIVEMASDAAAFPLLSAEAAEDPQGLVHYAGIVAAEHHKATGKVLAISEILGHMESQIRARLERLQPGQSASQPKRAASPPEGKSEPALPTPNAAKPEAAQRSPGRTLSLDQAAQDSGRKRVLTDAERLEQAAKLLPDWTRASA